MNDHLSVTIYRAEDPFGVERPSTKSPRPVFDALFRCDIKEKKTNETIALLSTEENAVLNSKKFLVFI